MITVIYYIDANEGRTYDEPYRPNVTKKITFGTEAEYASWLERHPEVTITKEDRK